MATVVQGIEKEIILKTIYMEAIPVICMYNREEYTLKIEKLTKNEIIFKPDRIIIGLTAEAKIDLTFDYKGMVVVFVVGIRHINEDQFLTTIPEFFYKNLDRSSPRVNFPLDMQLKFLFLDDRYLLPLAEEHENKSPAKEDLLPDSNSSNFNAIIAALTSWIKGYADEYKLVFFKETKPLSLEEQILAKTGKTLFLPSCQGSFPETDPHPKKRLITQELFRQYLESIGVLPVYFGAAEDQFIKSKLTNQVFSDLWVPLCFKGYVPGYIHVWTNKKEKSPLEYTVIETLYQYANSLILSLKEKGYFDAFCLKDKPIKAQGIDISVGGIRFFYPQSYISAALQLDTELGAKLITPKRTINVKARILRRYEEKASVFLGCHFLDMVPEDIRFLYEYIYGKPFTNLEDSCF